MSIVEQRYQAVMAVQAGDHVMEVAEKAGVSRQSVHAWLRRYADEGLPGLQDRCIVRTGVLIRRRRRWRRWCVVGALLDGLDVVIVATPSGLLARRRRLGGKRPTKGGAVTAPVSVGARCRRGRARLMAVAVASALLTACSDAGPPGLPPQLTSPAAAPVTRDHWPTAGWRRAVPVDHGIDPAILAKLEADLTREYVHVRSFLVVRNGNLVYERYRRGLDATSGHDVRSVTKSVIGALVGIAIAEGNIKGLEQTVGELLPAQLPRDADPRVAGITVGQLLTMTSGIYANDDSAIDDGLVKSADWIRYILSQKLDNDPGTRFGYSDASAHVLSAIVATVSGQSTLAYARARLFGPLGIRTDGAFEPVMSKVDAAADKAYERAAVAWPVDPQGYHFGAALLRLPSRELAKIGFLYLNGGRWDGAQLVPADYVAAATSSEGSSPNLSAGYGRLWWVGTENGHRIFSARGVGGQYIVVVPDLDLVVVVTSDVEAPGLDPIILISGLVAAVKD